MPDRWAVPALLLFTAAASAADFPKGTLAATRADADSSIQFDGKGMFTVTRDGEMIVVEGEYKASRDEIGWAEEKGPRAGPIVGPGESAWEPVGKGLTFTEVEDEAGGRAQALTHGDATPKD